MARAGVGPRQWRWPLGEIDRPFEMRRDPLVFDARSSAGNMVIHGGPKSGKSTALQTFILSAASLHSPHEVSFYCLDYGGGQLRALQDLAHVGSVASALEPERIRRTFGELEQLLLSRQQREVFRDRGANGSTPDDGFGEVFLVIDNLYGFGRDNTDQFNTRNPLLARVTELVNVGLAYGIHVIITTPSWLEVPLAMRDGLGLRLDGSGDERGHERRHARLGQAGDDGMPARLVRVDHVVTEVAVHLDVDQAGREEPFGQFDVGSPGRVSLPRVGYHPVLDADVARREHAGGSSLGGADHVGGRDQL